MSSSTRCTLRTAVCPSRGRAMSTSLPSFGETETSLTTKVVTCYSEHHREVFGRPFCAFETIERIRRPAPFRPRGGCSAAYRFRDSSTAARTDSGSGAGAFRPASQSRLNPSTSAHAEATASEGLALAPERVFDARVSAWPERRSSSRRLRSPTRAMASAKRCLSIDAVIETQYATSDESKQRKMNFGGVL